MHIIINHRNNTHFISNRLLFSCSKRIVNISRTEDDVHLVHREMANGNHTKSVQVDFDRFQILSISKHSKHQKLPNGNVVSKFTL